VTERSSDGSSRPGDVTILLHQLKSGGPDAFARLLDRIYPVLRKLARRHFERERRSHILQPTALINEAYLRLVAHADQSWNNRAHFYGAASQAMRRVLVDHARAARAAKRIDANIVLSIDAAATVADSARVDLLALDDALNALEKLSPRQARIVQLRFFCGLTIPEIAEALSITSRTVDRDWATARAWLRLRLQQNPMAR
jgi:RNA polymerase sigma factor (TIGR02999 family)